MLNLLPAKGGISAYLSPHTIITHRVVDYDCKLAISFGAYVQANQDNSPTNTNLPHTLECIFLGPTTGKQPGYHLLNLATRQVIVRPKVRELPITDLIIDAVNQMATKDGIKSMKFSTIDGLPFEDPAWIAGADSEESNNDDDKSYSNESNSRAKSDAGTDTESEPNEQPDNDNKMV